MKYIFLASDELRVRATREEHNDVLLGIYSKEKLKEYIEEFAPIKHPLPIYRFLNPAAQLLETYELAKFAKECNLDYKSLIYIHNHPSKSYKGWIKAPEETDYQVYYQEQLKNKNKAKTIYSKFSLKNDFIVQGI